MQAGPHTCSNKALALDDLETRYAAIVAIQAILQIALMGPAADSLHLAAVLCLPADMHCVLCMYSSPALLVEGFPGFVGSLVMAQVPPVLAGRTDAAEVFGREVAEYLMHAPTWKRCY